MTGSLYVDMTDYKAAALEEGTEALAGILGIIVLIVIFLGLLLYYALFNYWSMTSCEAIIAGLAPATLVKAPTTLAFKNIGYKLKGRQILRGVNGIAPAGEILAIMGPSGSKYLPYFFPPPLLSFLPGEQTYTYHHNTSFSSFPSINHL